MSWDTEGLDCFQSLVNIMNVLLRQPLNKENEGQELNDPVEILEPSV